MLLFRWRQVLSVVKSKGVRVVFPYGNLHPQVCPLDFSSAPCDGRVDGDDIFNTEQDYYAMLFAQQQEEQERERQWLRGSGLVA